MGITFKPPLKPPPCPVHCNSAGVSDGVEEVITVPDGYLAIIGPPETVAMYAGDSVPCKLARPAIPPRHPVQLLIAMASVPDDPSDGDDWEGDDIEPLRGGAFALSAGVVIERDSCWHICLYNERTDCHTVIANWMIPSVN